MSCPFSDMFNDFSCNAHIELACFILQNGRRPLLQLLHPNCARYLSPSDFASLNSSIPSLCSKVNFPLSRKVQSETTMLLKVLANLLSFVFLLLLGCIGSRFHSRIRRC